MLIYYACEDATLGAVAHKLIEQKQEDCIPWPFDKQYGGRSDLLKRRIRYNRTVKDSGIPMVLFIDLDKDACAPSLLQQYSIEDQQPPERFQIRIAVRTVESWLLADKEGIEEYFGIPQEFIPSDPEGLSNPKQTLLDLIASQAEEKFKDEMLRKGQPIAGTEYNFHLGEFVDTVWNSTRACANANSLTRAINGIRQITP